MILLGYQVDTPANWPAAFNFDAMVALKSIPLRYRNWSRSQNEYQSACNVNVSKAKMKKLVFLSY